jgi:hypothetical protein
MIDRSSPRGAIWNDGAARGPGVFCVCAPQRRKGLAMTSAIEIRRFETPDQMLDMQRHGHIAIVKMAD